MGIYFIISVSHLIEANSGYPGYGAQVVRGVVSHPPPKVAAVRLLPLPFICHLSAIYPLIYRDVPAPSCTDPTPRDFPYGGGLPWADDASARGWELFCCWMLCRPAYKLASSACSGWSESHPLFSSCVFRDRQLQRQPRRDIY